MSNDFLPPDYEVPETPGKYMKFLKGENKFRILSSPIMGYEWWADEAGNVRPQGAKPQKGDKPVRVRMGEEVPMAAADTAKHFWAMGVFNYANNSIQVLQITQKTLQRSLKELIRNAKWGNPMAYDLNVTRSGDGLETEYTMMPDPKTEMDQGVLGQYAAMQINLEVLFDNGDPFATAMANQAIAPITQQEIDNTDVTIEEVDEVLGKGKDEKAPF
jgi:hypothetical protein